METTKIFHSHKGFSFGLNDLYSTNIPELNNFGNVKYYYHCRGLDGDNELYRWKAPSGQEVMVYREQYWYNSGITVSARICNQSRVDRSVWTFVKSGSDFR